MPAAAPRRDLPSAPALAFRVLIAAIVVGALYWARAVLIPLALAIFLSFVLGPSVTRLRRLGLGRVPAVLVVIGVASLFIGAVGYMLFSQVQALIVDLPNHAEKIRTKLESVRGWTTPDPNGSFSRLLTEVEHALKPSDAPTPIPVVLATGQPAWLTSLEAAVGPILDVLGHAALTFLLAIFLLLNREDMRNRFVRLVGPRRITATTKAMDDAATRISRFLRMQLIINASFGVVLAAALLVIGVPYAILWGFFATLMRYVPYVGSVVGVVPPLVAAVAMSETWWPPVGVLAVYIALELIVANVAEPRLLGHSLGMSEVAQIFSAAFWAFLWGPIGLVLSGPLTGCIVVLSKHVPQMQALEILLGTEEALPPDVALFQRLTARDVDEAGFIATEFKEANGKEPVRDALLVPVLSRAQTAASEHLLSEEDAGFITDNVRELAYDLDILDDQELGESEGPRVNLLVVPVGMAGDGLAADLFVAGIDHSAWNVKKLAPEALASELLSAVREFRPAAAVIISLANGHALHARYLAKRLHSHFPDLKLIAGRWTAEALDVRGNESLIAAGATEIHATIAATMATLTTWWTPLAQTSAAKNGRRPVAASA